MLKDEIKFMLSSIIANKRAFEKFYKTGYFSYSKDKPFKEAVAIVNDKAIVSFLQNVDDDSEVIATASFQDNTTLIFQLMGDNFSRTQFGIIPQRYSSHRKSIISDIASVRRNCAEVEERVTSSNPNFIKSIFSKDSQSSVKKLSKQDVRFLLENTLDKLHKSRNLNNRSEISPKVETTSLVTDSTYSISHSINDKTPEI